MRLSAARGGPTAPSHLPEHRLQLSVPPEPPNTSGPRREAKRWGRESKQELAQTGQVPSKQPYNAPSPAPGPEHRERGDGAGVTPHGAEGTHPAPC